MFMTATLVLAPGREAHERRHLHVAGAGYAFVDAVAADWHPLVGVSGTRHDEVTVFLLISMA